MCSFCRNCDNHEILFFFPLTGNKDASIQSNQQEKVNGNTFMVCYLVVLHSYILHGVTECHPYNCHHPRKGCKEAAGISFRHAAHVLTNMGVMKGTQVQMHIIIIIRADKKRQQQETTDMSQPANNNFLILEIFSST